MICYRFTCRSPIIWVTQILAFCLCAVVGSQEAEKKRIRIGYFPVLTHAQALIGRQLGWFEEKMGGDVEIEWMIYTAGPSAMEAIFTNSLDMSYVGPNPAINAYLRSKGKEVRIVCGSCSGGAALVVQGDSAIKRPSDFKGKKIGTPQFGNTQDVAARSWFRSQGFKVTKTGGDVLIIPTQSSDQFHLFQQKQLDGVWTIEPWVSELILEAKGHLYLEEKLLWPETGGQYVTAHLVSRKNFLDKNPALVKKWIQAHVELTEWIHGNEAKAKELLQKALRHQKHFELKSAIIDRAWDQIELTYNPVVNSLYRSARDAYELGFLPEKPNLKGIYHLQLLNEVLKEREQEGYSTR